MKELRERDRAWRRHQRRRCISMRLQMMRETWWWRDKREFEKWIEEWGNIPGYYSKANLTCSCKTCRRMRELYNKHRNLPNPSTVRKSQWDNVDVLEWMDDDAFHPDLSSLTGAKFAKTFRRLKYNKE
jgi:hypothetical protein